MTVRRLSPVALSSCACVCGHMWKSGAKQRILDSSRAGAREWGRQRLVVEQRVDAGALWPKASMQSYFLRTLGTDARPLARARAFDGDRVCDERLARVLEYVCCTGALD